MTSILVLMATTWATPCRTPLHDDSPTHVIALQWSSQNGTVLELRERMSKDALADRLQSRGAIITARSVIIEATTSVPWRDVLDIMRICQKTTVRPPELRMAETPFAAELGAAKVSPTRIVRVVSPPTSDVDSPIVVRVQHAPSDECACSPFFDARQPCADLAHWCIEVESSARPAPDDPRPLQTCLQREADKKRDGRNPLLSGRRVRVAADALAPYGFARSVIQATAGAGMYRLELEAIGGEAVAYELPIATGMLGH